MFAPDPFAPPGGAFAEPWHAQVLALAHALKEQGHVTPNAWAEALGAALAEAEAAGMPDTEDTYYTAALTALELVSVDTGISAKARTTRKSEWKAAYLRTPHGQPVVLDPPS